MHVILVNGWPLEVVMEIGGWQACLQLEKGWVQGRKPIFIFDEAQLSYEDPNFLEGVFQKHTGLRSWAAIARIICKLWQSNFSP